MVSILTLLIIGSLWFFLTPVDIRPNLIKDNITEEQRQQGKDLLKEVQDAYGGINHWLAQGIGIYDQTADWYDDKLGVSGWDELPQQFEMTSTLGTDNSKFKLLYGPNKDQVWGVEDCNTYEEVDGQKRFELNKKYRHKLIYKNYWFQFPFRISEAPIIVYAGEQEVHNETYDLIYATWGSDAANRKYDQYVMYVNKDTKMIEWLHFTLREKINFIHITCRFSDFQKINGIVSPFTQYVTLGSPESNGRKMHENRYEWIQFGDEKVTR